MRSIVLVALATVVLAGKLTNSKPATCCKIIGSPDCVSCDNKVPKVEAELRDKNPGPKTLNLPKADQTRFNYTPKLLLPRPRIVTAEADDITNGAPIACPQGSPNCYRPLPSQPCTDNTNFQGPCLRPGQNVGPFLRAGGAFAPLYPAPYGLPRYPFSPDSQDWTRPALLTALTEGEISEKKEVKPEAHTHI